MSFLSQPLCALYMEREWQRQVEIKAREIACMCVCVCVCVREREREKDWVWFRTSYHQSASAFHRRPVSGAVAKVGPLVRISLEADQIFPQGDGPLAPLNNTWALRERDHLQCGREMWKNYSLLSDSVSIADTMFMLFFYLTPPSFHSPYFSLLPPFIPTSPSPFPFPGCIEQPFLFRYECLSLSPHTLFHSYLPPSPSLGFT